MRGWDSDPIYQGVWGGKALEEVELLLTFEFFHIEFARSDQQEYNLINNMHITTLPDVNCAFIKPNFLQRFQAFAGYNH
jgi:hypothetical protein